MRMTAVLSILLTFLLSLSLSLAAGIDQPRDLSIFAWPLSSPKHQTLAKLSYNSTHVTLKSYTPPKISSSDDIVRIGFSHPSGSWAGVATATSNFAPELDRTLTLHVNARGEAYHVGFKATMAGGSHGSGRDGMKDGLSVEVKRIKEGSVVHLNKPVVVSPDGKVEEKEGEKSFLQKYWWAIAGFLVLQFVLQGGKGD